MRFPSSTSGYRGPGAEQSSPTGRDEEKGKCVGIRRAGCNGVLQSWWTDEWEESGDNRRFAVATIPKIPGMIGHVGLTKDGMCIGFRHERQVGAVCYDWDGE